MALQGQGGIRDIIRRLMEVRSGRLGKQVQLFEKPKRSTIGDGGERTKREIGRT